MYIVAGQGQTIPGDKILMSTETSCHFDHLLSSLKNLFDIGFYTMLFYDFIHVYSSGQELTTPWGQDFDINRYTLSIWSCVASFKSISLKSDFRQFFHDFIHVYSPWAGADNPAGGKVLMSTELSCHLIRLLQV